MGHSLDTVNALSGSYFSGMPLINFGKAAVLILHWRVLCGREGRGDHNSWAGGSYRALLAVVSFTLVTFSIGWTDVLEDCNMSRLFLVIPWHPARTWHRATNTSSQIN